MKISYNVVFIQKLKIKTNVQAKNECCGHFPSQNVVKLSSIESYDLELAPL
jgi:hypothetical protein